MEKVDCCTIQFQSLAICNIVISNHNEMFINRHLTNGKNHSSTSYVHVWPELFKLHAYNLG